MPAPLIFSVNNIYTGLIRANIRYGENGVWERFLMEVGYFSNREGGKCHPPTLPGKLDS